MTRWHQTAGDDGIRGNWQWDEICRKHHCKRATSVYQQAQNPLLISILQIGKRCGSAMIISDVVGPFLTWFNDEDAGEALLWVSCNTGNGKMQTHGSTAWQMLVQLL